MLHWITNFSHNGTPKGIKSSVHYLYLSDAVLNSSCRLFSLTFSYGITAQSDLVSFFTMCYFPVCQTEPFFRQTTWGADLYWRIKFLIYLLFQYQNWKRSFLGHPAYDWDGKEWTQQTQDMDQFSCTKKQLCLSFLVLLVVESTPQSVWRRCSIVSSWSYGKPCGFMF